MNRCFPSVPSKALVRALGVLALLLAGAAAWAAEAPKEGANTIKGRLARADGTPVKGVKVQANLLPNDLKSGFKQCGETVTDDKGGFLFPNLPDGFYCLLAERKYEGHVEQLDLANPVNAYVEKGMTVDLGSVLFDVVNTTIRGRIVNPDHDGEVLVSILEKTRIYWQQCEGTLLGPGLSMDDGFFSFRLWGWHKGLGESLILRIVYSDGMVREQRVRVKSGGLATVEIPSMWYTHYITGRVSSGGKPLKGVKLLVVPDQPGRFVALTTPTLTSDRGTYRIDALAPGRWKIYAFRSPWEVMGKRVELDGKPVSMLFDFPQRKTHAVDFTCKVTVEGVDYGAWLRRTMPVPGALKRMSMVFALVPEGFDIRKDCLPPAAAFLSCDAGTYKTTLSNVPTGKYRVFLGLGTRAMTDTASLGKRGVKKGGAYDPPICVSPCGWVPSQHPTIGFAGIIDGTVVEVKAGGKISLSRDFKLEELLMIDKLPHARHSVAFFRKVLDDLKGGGE